MTVEVFMYDISGGMAAQMSLMLLGFHLPAVWHTSIVAFGREFYFDGGVGVCETAPRASRWGHPLQTQRHSPPRVTEAAFREWLRTEGARTYGPNDYNLLSRNCNNFTAAALHFVTGEPLSEDVTTMIPRLLSTPLGAMLRPMLEQVRAADGFAGLGPAAAGGLQQAFPQRAVHAVNPSPPPAAAASSIPAVATATSTVARPVSEDDINAIVASLTSGGGNGASGNEDVDFVTSVVAAGGAGTFMPPSERSMQALRSVGFTPVPQEEYLLECRPADSAVVRENLELLGLVLSSAAEDDVQR